MQDLNITILRCVALHNHQLPQPALKGKTPIQGMKQWHQTHPYLFNKPLYNRAGCDKHKDDMLAQAFVKHESTGQYTGGLVTAQDASEGAAEDNAISCNGFVARCQ